MPKYEKNLWSVLSEKSCYNFTITERLNMAIDLCEEVKKVHENIIHRDIKPSNIMIEASGQVKLVDFGIGKPDKYLTGSYGTPGFLAPEQFACYKQTNKVDIWALGKVIALILFEWRSAWKLLWSPNFLTPTEIRSLGPLSKIIELVQNMVEVNQH